MSYPYWQARPSLHMTWLRACLQDSPTSCGFTATAPPLVTPACSWANLFQADALLKLVPTSLSCLAMILTLERFSHPLALPAGKRGKRALLHEGRASPWAHPCHAFQLLHFASMQPAAGLRLEGACAPAAAKLLPPVHKLALALAAVMLLINAAFHVARLALGVTLEQAMDANWVIRPAVRGVAVGVRVGWGHGLAQDGRVRGRGVGGPRLAASAGAGSAGLVPACDLLAGGLGGANGCPALVGCGERCCLLLRATQEGEQYFWQLWDLFNIKGWSLRQGGQRAGRAVCTSCLPSHMRHRAWSRT